MVAILEKNEHNADFYPIVDFIEASPLRVKAQEHQLSPHPTPSQEAQPSSPTHISTSSIPTVIPIPTVTQSELTPLRQYTRRARIAQSSFLPPIADEPASPVRDSQNSRGQPRSDWCKICDDAPIKGKRKV
nr:hypothetical protein [Tanacetum cinerariifolium]